MSPKTKFAAIATALLVMGLLLGIFIAPLLHTPPSEKLSGESGEAVQGTPNFEADGRLEFDYVNGTYEAYISVRVRNVGYKHISVCNLTVYGDLAPLTIEIGAIGAGQEVNVYKRLTNHPFVYPGKEEYNATIIAVAPDGTKTVKNIAVPNFGAIVSARGQISIEAVDLVKNTAGDVTFSITLKNTGNKPAVSLNVTLQGQTNPLVLNVAGNPIDPDHPLQPGQSATALLNLDANDPTNKYVVGNSYNVVIEAQFSDGSVYTKTEAVMCRYG
jgi:hypothetical protein